MKKAILAAALALMLNQSARADVTQTAQDMTPTAQNVSTTAGYFAEELTSTSKPEPYQMELPPTDPYDDWVLLHPEEAKKKIQTDQSIEKGLIPILDFHKIVTKPKWWWNITPATLETILDDWRNLGFVPVSLDDALEGTIDIPKGKMPLVITADDTLYNPRLISIYKKYSEDHPDFPFHLTLFINSDEYSLGNKPKDDVIKTIEEYKKEGISVQSHGALHRNLKDADLATVQKEIDDWFTIMKEYGINEEDVRYFAYPYGISATSKDAQDWLSTKFKACFTENGGSFTRRHMKKDSLSNSRIDGSDEEYIKYYYEKNKDKFYTKQ